MRKKNTNSYICGVLLTKKTQSIKMAGDVFFFFNYHEAGTLEDKAVSVLLI